MILDYAENIVQLIAAIIALLVSVTSYISSKNRVWLCAVGFYTGTLLSCYFWTSYLIIMGEQPAVSDFITNFGWNMSYFMMLLLTCFIKKKDEIKYFHPLMLVPIPLNIWQLILYFDFGGIANSIYQVTICTAIACFAIQGVMWYIKERKNGARKPYIETVLIIGIISEFGMWTCSCFDGLIGDMYYLSSFLCSACYLLIVWAAHRTYRSGNDNEGLTHIGKIIQNVMKGSYVAIVLTGSVGGILLGIWILNILIEDGAEESAYDILPVVLFIISVVLAIFALVMIFIVYFGQKLSENQRLREATQVAERSNAAKSDFLANMSHEIRTPINAVLGMNRMIMRDSLKALEALPDEKDGMRQRFRDITGYSANIDNAGTNLLSIINDILDFSKIEAGKLKIVERKYMLSSVLNDVSNTVMFKARDKGLEFRVDSDNDIPDELFGDEVRIRQVIINILNNAVKYTDKGSVSLSVFGGGKRRYEPGGSVELIMTVTDTGIGIKEEDLEKIFGKFERTDMQRNSTVEGTGLGLAITRHLLEAMNGSVSVKSEYGKGSVFTIRIPQKIVSTDPIGDFREKFEKSIGEMRDTEDIFRAPEARILIVDDTRMNLVVAAGLIKDTEIISDTAESGADALKLALEKNYDLILLDQRMPGMDGTETLRRLREQEKGGKNVPVICLTADAISGAKERYLAEGFSDYLSKPIDSRELKKMLMKYLPSNKIIVISDDKKNKDSTASAVHDETEPSCDIAKLCEDLRNVGVNTDHGLAFCQNNSELYRTILIEYAKSAADKTMNLKRFCDEHDLKNYGTVVHSLKSVSRTIGAAAVAERAAMLEAAADEGDEETVIRETPGLLEAYEKVVSAIGAVDSASSDPSDDDEIMEFMPE